MRQVQLPSAPGKSDRLLQGIAVLYTDGYPKAAAGLLDTVREFGEDELTMDEAVRFAWLAACAATDLWDDVNWGVLTQRHLAAIRQIGALSVLPVALNSRIVYDLYSGDLAEAEALVAECEWIADVTEGQNAMIPYGDVSLHAIRGDNRIAEPQFEKIVGDIAARGEGVGMNMTSWFQSIMYNGLGRYDEALEAARTGAASPLELGPPKWVLAELVEAGVRSGNTDEAASAHEQLAYFAQASGTEAALGVLAGRTALLRTGMAAEACHHEAIERLGHTTLRVEHARARLRYGEWLRQEGRRLDARTQLRSAYEALSRMGVDGYAERARRELVATGESVARQAVETSGDLTAQEAHIARLVAEGHTNSEIGAILYISPRTVEWHLRKVFAKLGVTTRRQLRTSVPAKRPQR
jgi:DNA-binding CsgD family transcriptional regulator